MIDFIIGTLILIAVILAVRSIKNKKSAGCCSGCAGCPSSRDKCNVSEVFEAETRKNLKNKDQG
ncbi:MAG: FeoB-associated Cys-rich membrane protein [Anaerovoracaceae bacterium]|jgi:hypothetical protein|nr:FeoB-associated Cys-rich membrane protein [Clostridiales bacterium]